MKITKKQIILNVLRERNDWVPLWDLVKVNTKWGWLSIAARTRCQELAQEGKIQHKIEGKYSYYRVPEIKYREAKVIDTVTGEVLKTIKLPI